MVESKNNKKKEEVYEKIEVEIVPSTNVKNVAELKNRIESEKKDSKTDKNSGKNEFDKKHPKKKWKKQDFINSGQMPPANRLIPAIVLIVMLVGTYIGLNSLVFNTEQDYEINKSMISTGWQDRMKKIEAKYAEQQNQLKNLQDDIKKHSALITENKTQMGKNSDKIKKTNAELNKVDEDLKDFKNKTGDEIKELLSKKQKIEDDLKKLEDEQKKMKDTDEQLKNDVKKLDQMYRDMDNRLDDMAGAIGEGIKERQQMKDDFKRLLDELRKQGIEVPDYGKDEEKNQP